MHAFVVPSLPSAPLVAGVLPAASPLQGSAQAAGVAEPSSMQSAVRNGALAAAAVSATAAGFCRRNGRAARAHRLQGYGGSVFAAMASNGHAMAKVVRQAGTVAAPAERIGELISSNKVMVFSKSWCPYCSQAKDILKSEGIDFEVLELDTLPDEEAAALQNALMEKTGARTVPRVFVDKECIGGCDDVTSMYQSGKLKELVGGGAGSGGTGFQKVEKSAEQWAEELDQFSYYVLRNKGTEPGGSHPFNNFMPTQGYFGCGACGFPLYSAKSKFSSFCGWPVFDKCYFSKDAGGCHVGTNPEFGALEIVCKRCDSHLGHVFFDAFSPKNPNGERH
eukprot:TRINITY_DN74576_c0_g1_i1.p2 TRINITY_DN74576_c0_g1~~TRINITY_DN74576_c0_g1_i1.p2  ORF type:complete len:335 (-),score=77.91 TRINITY_DN74576_c0_g1_i1:459-1463(-)